MTLDIGHGHLRHFTSLKRFRNVPDSVKTPEDFVEFKLAKAKEIAGEAFYTKQALKDAFYYLNEAFDILQPNIFAYYDENVTVEIPKSIPMLHNYNHEKHSEIFEPFADLANKISILRKEYKERGVVEKVKVKKEIKFSERQATHRGTCQICGSLHKVSKDNGKLAQHGYTKQFGWFSDSCWGSNNLPFEKSNADIFKYLDLLESQIVKTEKTTVNGKVKIEGREYFSSYIIDGLKAEITLFTKRAEGWKPRELHKIEIWE